MPFATVSALNRRLQAPAHPPVRLLNFDFAILWQGQSVSQLGNQALNVAIAFWATESTRSTAITGLLLMAGLVPILVLGPFAGTFVDGHSRKRVIVTCDAVRGVVVSCLAVAFVFTSGALRVAVAFAAVVCLGTLTAFFEPALAASIPDLVPSARLESANGFQQSSTKFSMMMGQALGGVLYHVFGAPLLFLLDGLSFFFAGACGACMRIPEVPAPARAPERSFVKKFLTDTLGGLRYALSRPGLASLLVLSAVFNLFLAPVPVLLPAFVTQYLHGDARWYGLLLAGMSSGAMVGYWAAGFNKVKGLTRPAVVVGLFAAIAFNLMVLGQIRERWLVLGGVFLHGLLAGLITIRVMTILQRSTPPEGRGRVMGVFATISQALMPIGLVGGGLVADLLGRNVPLIFAGCGGLANIALFLVASRSNLCRFLASDR